MIFRVITLAVALRLVGVPGSAQAQPAPPADPTPPIAPAEAPSSSKQVEAAKDTQKAAALTAIKGSPNDTLPAFQLYAEVDLPIVGIGLVFAGARIVKQQPAYCAPVCNQHDLNPIDRLTAGYWSPAWSLGSDFALYGLGAGAVALLVVDEGGWNALNDGVVVAEATLSSAAVASIMTLAAGRPRPYLFGDPANPDQIKAPLADRNSPNGGLSFLSGHTTMAFAIATSLYVTEKRLHPKSNRPRIILGVGLTVAAFVGLARVMAGQHFITDVVGGAVVGTSLGVVVASVHGSPVGLVPVVSDTQAGLGIQGRF